MRIRSFRVLAIAASAAVMLAAGSTMARASTLEAHVPFSFIVNGTRLPAGTYELRPLSNLQRIVWEVQNHRGTRAVFVLTSAFQMPRASASPQLDFAVMGGQHFLSQIVSDYYGQGRDTDLTPRTMERQLVHADRVAG